MSENNHKLFVFFVWKYFCQLMLIAYHVAIVMITQNGSMISWFLCWIIYKRV